MEQEYGVKTMIAQRSGIWKSFICKVSSGNGFAGEISGCGLGNRIFISVKKTLSSLCPEIRRSTLAAGKVS